ncbi:MAG TPA: hypothetical protein VGS12_16160 [Caulobacteraceae bacterium]|nr:hypothetical protein [Caulobacteraceae bacterium]
MKIGEDHTVTTLARMQLGQSPLDGGRREKFVQDLVHDHPEVLPMLDIEPAFSPLLPVCKELETAAGYIDNLWLTPAGGIVFGECKLFRNPQARREVIAQSLDYARALAAWTYDDLQGAVRKALGRSELTLWSLVEKDADLSEAQFIDAIERRLRTGQLMILIIGDGIQEGVEALTEHVQMHAGIHAGMALVDLSIWSDPAGGLIVVPRIPMRTVLIERGVVRFDPGSGVRVAIKTIGGGSLRRAKPESDPNVYGPDNKPIDVALLLRNAPAWRDAIATFVEAMRSEDR